MTKLEQLADGIYDIATHKRTLFLDETVAYEDLLRAAQKVVDWASAYVDEQTGMPRHHWVCHLHVNRRDRFGHRHCTCGATALFTALAAFRAAEAKGPA